MTIKNILLTACAAATLVCSTASAQPGWVPPGNDPAGYYSDSDRNGYYDRDGRYRRLPDRAWRDGGDSRPPENPAAVAWSAANSPRQAIAVARALPAPVQPAAKPALVTGGLTDFVVPHLSATGAGPLAAARPTWSSVLLPRNALARCG